MSYEAIGQIHVPDRRRFVTGINQCADLLTVTTERNRRFPCTANSAEFEIDIERFVLWSSAFLHGFLYFFWYICLSFCLIRMTLVATFVSLMPIFIAISL